MTLPRPATERRTQAERTATTRAALLAATVDALVDTGYRGTTTSDVARRAGVSYGALLHHYPTKAALLCAAVEHLLDQRIAEFRKSMANLSPGTPTRDAAIDVLWSMFQGSTFTAWLELRVAARTDPELAEAIARVDQQFADTSVGLFRELFPEDSAADPDLPLTAVTLLFTFLDGLALSNMAPACAQVRAEDLLNVFKLLVSSALPGTEPRDPEGNT
jgi:AcrR family transcriptional regulator